MGYLFYWPRSLAALLLLLFLAPTILADTRIRIMTANLTSGNLSKYESPGLDILQGLSPDIVAIQEFKYGGNTPTEIRAMVDSTFGPGFSYFREPGSYAIPNGVISRFPIAEAGSWVDAQVTDRGFAWARIQLTPTNDLYVVSVHLYSNGTAAQRNDEALAIKSQIQANFPPGAWVVVAGDFNTSSRDEPAIATFTSFLSDSPIPTDAEAGGDPDTNANRNSPYDYLLPSFSLTNALVPVVLPSHSFTNGLVFDSRVYSPLTDVPPVVSTDSGAVNMQHMGVVKDFLISAVNTNLVAPSILTQPKNQTNNAGAAVTFSVGATGTQPLSYQWRFNGSDITGAIASSYVLANVQASNEGNYSVFVTNVAGTIPSSNATLTVDSRPMISTQPQSQTKVVGDNVSFTVTAGGAAPLAFQWRFNGNDLVGATTNSFTRTNAQPADAGNYSVVITNSYGSLTSTIAVLTFASASSGPFARWDFNSLTSDTNSTTGTLLPSLGNGTVSYIGGTTAASTGEFAGGSATDSNTNDNSAWNTTSYPVQGTGNKTAGVRFNVSTSGKRDISIRWDHRASNTGSKYVRLQYTTNGLSFVDYPLAATVTTAFTAQTNDLTSIPAVNNNSNFAFRIVAEFESSAANTINSNYVAAGTTYGTGGTLRFDMVTVSGNPLNPPTMPASLSSPVLGLGQFQFNVQGSTGTTYVVQTSTNLGSSNWVSLFTNTAPFTLLDTNLATFPTRFYRAISLP